MNGSTIPPKALPINNINIAIVGCVSAGKSTILNALFCEDYAQSRIRRTTMMPSIFVESSDATKIKTQEEISDLIKNKNNEIYARINSGKPFSLHDFGNQLIFNVKKLSNVKFSDKFNVNIWDTPGLNDAESKDEYYKYLKKNFHLFNTIIFIVDIQRGLGTIEEKNILDFLIENISHHKKNSGKDIGLITIINKSDEMELKDGSLQIVSAELSEMFEQTKKTIIQKTERKGIANNVKILPICGRDAHIYRCIEKYGERYIINDPELILRIGVDLYGKNFSRQSAVDRQNIVLEQLKDKTHVRQMIELSGFQQMINEVSTFVNRNSIRYVEENCEYEYSKTPKVSIKNLLPTIKTNINVIKNFQTFNILKYNEKMKMLVKDIHTQIYSEISRYNSPNDIDKVKRFYDRIVAEIISDPYIHERFTNYWNMNIYPAYIKENIVNLINISFTEHAIPIGKLEYFNYLEIIGAFDHELIQALFDGIIKNVRGVNTFVFDDNSYFTSEKIIAIFNKLKDIKNFINFLRFFLLNMLGDKEINPVETIIYKSMYMKKFNEIPISSYIDMVLLKNIDTSRHLNMFVCGLNHNTIKSSLQNPFIVEDYYIETVNKIDNVNLI